MPACPLCHSPITDDTPYHSDKRRDYFQCPHCNLVFVPPDSLPSSQAEKNEYTLHQNHHGDAGYRRFLQKMTSPLLDKVDAGQRGLDFGCGPTPVLAGMLEDDGLSMSVYDPYFYPAPEALTPGYDFITCTEAIEHFHNPAKELLLLTTLLKPRGWLGIMTKRVIDQTRFATWHYKNDPTHVCFYSESTFEYIALKFGYTVSFPGTDTVLMQKNT